MKTSCVCVPTFYSAAEWTDAAVACKIYRALSNRFSLTARGLIFAASHYIAPRVTRFNENQIYFINVYFAYFNLNCIKFGNAHSRFSFQTAFDIILTTICTTSFFYVSFERRVYARQMILSHELVRTNSSDRAVRRYTSADRNDVPQTRRIKCQFPKHVADRAKVTADSWNFVTNDREGGTFWTEN